jgi:hypothetical protein
MSRRTSLPIDSVLLCTLLLPLSLGMLSSALAARPLPRAFTPVVMPAPTGNEVTAYPLYTFGAGTPGATQAVCNDGSPVHYAYLPAKSASSRKWMIFLEGGDRCSGFYSCLKRFIETPRRMSTTYQGPLAQTPPLSQTSNIDLRGIFLDSSTYGLPPNPYRENYHQVWVNYCSSDSWVGDGVNRMPQNNPAGGNGVEQVIDSWGQQLRASADPVISTYGVLVLAAKAPFLNQFCTAGQCTMHFRGATIVQTLLEDLKLNRGLRAPEQVLLAGSSAGSLGSRQNLDRLATLLRRQWPRTAVLGASDSGLYDSPLAEVAALQPLPLLNSACNPAPLPPTLPSPALLPMIPATGSEYWGGVRVDESCFQSQYGAPRPQLMTSLAYQAADACFNDAILNSSINTPYFIFEGYRDRIYLPGGALNNVNCNNPAGIENAVTRASHNELLSSGRAAFGVDTPLHTSMQGEFFFNLQRTDPSVSASPLSHASVLWRWLETNGRYNHTILECPPGCAVACGRQACP